MTTERALARYGYDWARWTDWATARGYDACPADPLAIMAYLAAHTGSTSTKRGWVSAINHHHRAAGYPPPGRAAAVKAAWTTARHRAQRDRVDEVIATLPEWGWPQGLFGRRDAAILVLAAAGLPHSTIAALRHSDIVLASDCVMVGPQPLAVLDERDDPDRCPVAIIDRWLTAASLIGASMIPVREWLTTGIMRLGSRSPSPPSAPLFVAIDRDGLTPFPPTHLAPSSVRAIITNHLDGRSPTHQARGRISVATPAAPEPEAPQLPDTHAHGLAARRAALDAFADVDRELEAAEMQFDLRIRQVMNQLGWS